MLVSLWRAGGDDDTVCAGAVGDALDLGDGVGRGGDVDVGGCAEGEDKVLFGGAGVEGDDAEAGFTSVLDW